MHKVIAYSSFLLLPMTLPHARSQVVINEIMYHDATDDRAEEFVELYNTGAEAADLTGWRFTEGITFVFPVGLVIDAGGYLVLCADSATFISRHPGVINVVGDFTGRLSNDGERITLRDSLSGMVDSLE